MRKIIRAMVPAISVAGANRIRDGGSEKSVGGSRPRVEGCRAMIGGDGTVVVAVIPAKVAIVSRRWQSSFGRRTLVHPMRAVEHALIPSMLRTSVVRCVHASHESADGSCHLLASASHPLACSTRLCAVGDEISNVTTDFGVVHVDCALGATTRLAGAIKSSLRLAVVHSGARHLCVPTSDLLKRSRVLLPVHAIAAFQPAICWSGAAYYLNRTDPTNTQYRDVIGAPGA